MAFLRKGLKADLQIMATEMGVEDVLSLKVFELREAILNNKNFDEEFCREQLNTIIGERKRKEEMEMAERKRLAELEERKRKDEMDFELQKKRIELEGGGSENEVKESGQFKIDLHKLMPKCRFEWNCRLRSTNLCVRADLVKDIESTGEGKIKLISAFGDSDVAPLRTFNIKIDDRWHDAIPITCAVSKKLVNDMFVCQTAYEALLESI
ncbi:CCHC-type domain-containing protein [Trichonephila clavata]|uniref:CCHC-type domain-containing protein n=1 Tax=Trichonephila clavata TaxID=2740835 RepID=A0A8X6HU25_TRICU|nr:CCHC-type domain-containing protein [Trichonephila clavata]